MQQLVNPNSPSAHQLIEFASSAVLSAADQFSGRQTVVKIHQFPTITNYVVRLEFSDGSQTIAKYPILGVSLVSLSRGVCGGISQISAMQHRYIADGDSLAMREMQQLQFLNRYTDLKTPRAYEVINGVLFTEPLATRCLKNSKITTSAFVDSLSTGLASLYRLQPYLDGCNISSHSHTDILGTFIRKFTQPNSYQYIASLGIDRYNEQRRFRLLDKFQASNYNLINMIGSTLDFCKMRPTYIFGDLKPEHVFVLDHGQIQYLDPGMHIAHPIADLAKYVSRTVLEMITTHPSIREREQTIAFLDQLVDRFLEISSAQTPSERSEYLRNFRVLWAMDTANILSTALATPIASGFPWPNSIRLLSRHAPTVSDFVFRLSQCNHSRKLETLSDVLADVIPYIDIRDSTEGKALAWNN